MSTQPEHQNKNQQPIEPLPSEPLPPAAAHRAEEEARQRPFTVSQEVIENRRRGRIEVETKRISEEVTRQAQERLRASQGQSSAPSASAIADSSASPGRKVTAVSQQAPLPLSEPIRRVVVPLDGTIYSERALPYLASVAHMTGADITLLTVIVERAAPAFDAVSRSVNRLLSETPATPVRNPADYLAEIQAQLAQRGIVVESMSVSASSPIEGVELVMERLDANLVALATHARYGIQQQILGSVGDQLVRRGKTPVLLIPPQADMPQYPLRIFSRILVPLDGSSLAEQVLAPILSLVQSATENEHVHIVLFYVADNHISRRDGVRYVESLKERLLTQPLPPSVEVTSVAVVGSPSGAIVAAATHGIINLPDYPEPFDLVAMATHGRGGLQRWLYGSVAAYVLPRIKTPVLLVHPHTPELSDM